jgi:RNA-directed DNA polymerase
MDELKAPGKPFAISKRAVWEAREKVKANKGASGADGVTGAEFESDLKNNLYKIWNRLSSGACFPPPVRAVEVPKPHGGGTRILGVPSAGDRVAQTVVAGVIESRSSTPVPAATGRGAPRWMRWPSAGGGAGRPAG